MHKSVSLFSLICSAAVDYMKANPVLPVDVASFEESCGVGVKITPDQVEDCVSTRQSNGVTFILPELGVLKFIGYIFDIGHWAFQGQ